MSDELTPHERFEATKLDMRQRCGAALRALVDRASTAVGDLRVAGGHTDHDVARAVLAVIRDASPELIEIGGYAYDRDAEHISTFHCLSVAWEEMIDVLLEVMNA